MATQALDFLAHPPEKLVAFVKRVIDEYRHYEGPDRRSCPRESISIPVIVQPLGADFKPDGEVFTALTKDLSGGGIGLIHSSEITSKYLKVTLKTKAEELDLLAEVRHCTKKADAFEIGGRFVVDWNAQSPAENNPHQ